MSRHGRVALALLSILTVLTMLAGACTPSPAPTPSGGQQPADTAAPKPTVVVAPTTPPAQPKIVTITFVQEPDNLNPLYTSMYFSSILRDFYLLSLWNFNEKGEPVPQIAAEIPSQENGGISADNLTFTIKLRPDAKWSDGVPVTADDFVFTYDMWMSDKNTVATRDPYPNIESIEAKDATTLVFKWKEPFAPWLTSLFLGVLPKHTLQPVFDKDGTLDQAEWNRNPAPGVGPFVVKEWVSGSHLSFVKNPNFWQPPKVDQIFVRIVPDDAAQLAAIKAGDTDIGVFLSAADVPDLEKLGTVETPLVGSGYVESIFFNMDPKTAHPAMLDANVRKAIALAINREQISKELLLGVNPVAATFWDTTPPYADPAIQPLPYDPAQAKQLLDAAGWKDPGTGVREKDGVKLHLRYITNDRELRKSVQAVVQQTLLEVGIEVELQNYNSDVYFNSFGQGGPVATGQYDLAEWSQCPVFPDPDTPLFLCSEIPSAEKPEGENWEGYCDPDVDRLTLLQRTQIDQAQRIETFKQIEKIIYDKTLWLGMWKDPDIYSTAKRVTGIKLSGTTPFWNSYDWDIP